MQFPLSLSEIWVWLAIVTILLLSTSEFLSPYYKGVGIVIEKKRLKLVASSICLLFISTFLVQLFIMLTEILHITI